MRWLLVANLSVLLSACCDISPIDRLFINADKSKIKEMVENEIEYGTTYLDAKEILFETYPLSDELREFDLFVPTKRFEVFSSDGNKFNVHKEFSCYIWHAPKCWHLDIRGIKVRMIFDTADRLQVIEIHRIL